MHSEMPAMFEDPVRRLVVGSSGYGLFYSVEPEALFCTRKPILVEIPRRFGRQFGACSGSNELTETGLADELK